jgi:hypothetical protein
LIKPISVAQAPLLLVCQRFLQEILDREFHGVVRSDVEAAVRDDNSARSLSEKGLHESDCRVA